MTNPSRELPRDIVELLHKAAWEARYLPERRLKKHLRVIAAELCILACRVISQSDRNNTARDLRRLARRLELRGPVKKKSQR